MNVKEIFISENENLIQKLLEENIDLTHVKAKKELTKISTKVFNNKVGYIAFKDNEDTLYKVYVVPKILDTNMSSQELKDQFFQYMKRAFELISKYGKKYYKEFKNYDTILLFHKRGKAFIDFEDVISFKYSKILQDIYLYFQKHMAYKVKYKAYYSQTLKHKLDLKRNIKELDKSKIHQIKKDILVYSKLAFITYQVLNTFQKTKLRILDKITRKNLDYLVNKLKILLRKKYKANTSKSMKAKRLLSAGIRALFKKTEDKKLYSLLLSLLSEEIKLDEKDKEITVIPDVLTFLISPEKIYELHVFDHLLIKLKGKDIKFQKSKKYKISINKESKLKESTPDILVKSKNTLFLIDVKWKTLKKEPSSEDILKLERDTKVWKNHQKEIIPILVYPTIKNSLFNKKLTKIIVEYNSGMKFKLYVCQVPI